MWQTNLWPGGIVPYAFDPAVLQINRDRTRIALDEISTFANVTFVPRTTEPNYINVRNSTGNSSFVGQIGGAQSLNMVSWSTRMVICHEFFHALGQWHHHQRFDRDEYVVINSQNIQAGREFNFDLPDAEGLNVVGPYNFSSIMHYSRCAFSNCTCPSTCTVIDAAPGFEQFNASIGNRSFMSQGDKDAIIAKYGPAIDDALEPNDTLGTPAALPLGTSTLKLLDFDDYFSVNRATAGELRVRFESGIWGDDNVTVSILTPGGTVLNSALADLEDPTYVALAQANVPAGVSIVRVTRVQPWGGGYTLDVSTPAGCVGDLTGDNAVNTADLTAFLGAFGTAVTPGSGADLTGDGLVNTADLTVFLGRFGTTCTGG